MAILSEVSWMILVDAIKMKGRGAMGEVAFIDLRV